MTTPWLELNNYVVKKPKGTDTIEKIEAKIISLVGQCSNPSSESLFKYLKYQQRCNPKVIDAYMNAWPKIDSKDSDMGKIITRIAGTDFAFFTTLVPKIESKGYILGQTNMNDFMRDFATKGTNSDALVVTNFCSVCMFYLNSQKATHQSLIEFLLFDEEFQSYNSNSSKWKKIIIDILTRCGCISTYQPTQKGMEDAYEKALIITISILQDNYNLKPTAACLKKLVASAKNAGNNRYSKGSTVRTMLSDMIKKYALKPDASDMSAIMELDGCDEIVRQMMDAHLLDLSIHGQAINDKFGCIDRPDTIRKLITLGYKPNQKNLESVCNGQGNIQIIRILVEDFGIKVNMACLENACNKRSNSHVINFLLEKCDTPPSSLCLLNHAKAVKNQSMVLLLEKFFKVHGSDDYLRPVYDSD